MIKSLKVVRSLYHADDPPKLNSCLTELEGLREMQSDGEGEEKNGIERGKEDSREEAFPQSGAEIKCKQENAKRKGSDTGELTTKDTLSTRSESNDCNQALTSSKTNAIAFHIPVQQTVCKPPPKRFCNQAKKGRENISIERIAEKQEMAERRKNQHMEQKLKRIHDRQEAARKLAHNVEMLLQQRSIQSATKAGANQNTPQMTSSQLLATARHVARDFRALTSQMTKDFVVDDRNNNLSKKSVSYLKSQEEKRNVVKSSNNDNKRGIAFTVSFDDNPQCLSPVPKALRVPKKTQKSMLTAQELQEKQQRAEERRNQRKQDRVKRTIANREALFKLASDLETFMIWNDKQCCHTASFEDHQTTQHQNQTAQLAVEIADGFDRLSQRYARDLKQAEEFSCSLWSPGQLQK